MNKSKVFYTVLIILTVAISTIGATYAYFAFSVKTEDNSISTSSGNYSLNLSVTPKYPDPEKGAFTLIPMKDELSEKAYVGYNNVPCIDKNNAAVCYVYEIVITDYNIDLDYVSGSINIETSNITNLSYRLYDENDNKMILEKDEEGNDIYIKKLISQEELSLGDSFPVKNKKKLVLNLMIWLSETGSSQNETDIGTFKGNVTFYTGQGGKVTGKLSAAIDGSYEG